MRVLLDGPALLWFRLGDARLSDRARRVMQSDDSDLVLSSVTAWEICTKAAKTGSGRLDLPLDPALFIRHCVLDLTLEVLPVQLEHVVTAAGLPKLHKDPFDRLLVAQSRLDNLPILTPDNILPRYQVATLW